jgi:hypothetical protein
LPEFSINKNYLIHKNSTNEKSFSLIPGNSHC